MPIDASIPLGVRTYQAPDPLEQYGKAMTIRGLMQQGELGALNLEKARSEMDDDRALRELAPQAKGDLTKLRDLVYGRGLFKQGMAIDQKLLEKQAKDADIKKNLATADKTTLETASQRVAMMRSAGQGAFMAYQAALQKGLPEPMARALAQPLYEQGISQLLQNGIIPNTQGIPSTFDPDFVKSKLDETMKWDDVLKHELEIRKAAETGRHNVATEANTVRGQDLTAQTMREGHGVQIRGQNVSAATARRGQDLTAGTARERLAFDTDPTRQAIISEAREYGQERGRGTAQAQMNLPQVTATAERGLRVVDELVGSEDRKIKPHPGFRSIVGGTLRPGARFVHGTPEADFQARLGEVTGGAFLQAFESLKGGGQITQIEGEKATQAINRMSIAQSEGEFVEAAREFQHILRKGLQRAKQKAGAPAAGGAAPAAGGTRFLGFENP